uniref:Transporter n=1 Tax=Petromyzon marinus TaxID=7757 RepID=A0AAJ7SKQ6_PETMA|nr:sodium-dependent proline transporter-like [Petromyzon marinus]
MITEPGSLHHQNDGVAALSNVPLHSPGHSPLETPSWGVGAWEAGLVGPYETPGPEGSFEGLEGMGEGGRGEPPGSPREQWGGRMEFLLSLLGYCVGLGNVWRFPYLCYRNGGGAFLIPYLLMLALCGLPVFLMELSLGQFSALGPLAVWRCCPILTGIGYAMLILSVLVSLYYVVIIAWTLFYLFSSFQSPLPWACEAPNNQHLCTNLTLNETHATPSEVFWNERVLQVGSTQGLHDPGRVRGELAGCLLLAWVIIWLCLFRGVRSSGKVVYVTATFPYAVLLILLVRGATLEGSLQGVAFYLTPQWERLAQPQVWNDAATQIFYSLGVGFGGLLSLASYNKHNNNVIRDTLIVALAVL